MPIDYVQLAEGRLGGSGAGTASQLASEWWKIVVGVIVIAVLIDVEPRLGGWLLLLIVLGLSLSSRGRAIITGVTP
jgi:hypothetical protein